MHAHWTGRAQAVLLTQQGDVRGAQALLEPLVPDLELMQPGMAARVCLLLLDLAAVASASSQAEGETFSHSWARKPAAAGQLLISDLACAADALSFLESQLLPLAPQRADLQAARATAQAIARLLLPWVQGQRVLSCHAAGLACRRCRTAAVGPHLQSSAQPQAGPAAARRAGPAQDGAQQPPGAATLAGSQPSSSACSCTVPLHRMRLFLPGSAACRRCALIT